MSIQVLASESHYLDHLQPVIDALPAGYARLARNARELNKDAPVLVASWKDYKATNHLRLPVIFSEHGVGYTYQGNLHAYAGGPGRDRVGLFLNANARVAARNEAAYPQAAHALTGSPRLDVLAGIPQARSTVTFSWHWDCHITPETRTAFPHYKQHLRQLSGQLAGHAHPRAWAMVQPTYDRLSWDIQRTFSDVVEQAALYVCDTSSTIYEAAALGIPVVVLNSPRYRRDVEHGLRFWQDIPGPQVNHPGELAHTIEQSLTEDRWAEERHRITELLYPHRGQAAARAADAIVAHVG